MILFNIQISKIPNGDRAKCQNRWWKLPPTDSESSVILRPKRKSKRTNFLLSSARKREEFSSLPSHQIGYGYTDRCPSHGNELGQNVRVERMGIEEKSFETGMLWGLFSVYVYHCSFWCSLMLTGLEFLRMEYFIEGDEELYFRNFW